ncbi:MAG: hypothetical protein IPP78_03775 [Holophagaceae bacterium]|nr:hypothetical protein [Holophagaceae bacterium]
MLLLQAMPILFAVLLLAAHALRSGNLASVVITLLFPLLFAVRRPWAATILQLGLVLGSLEWVRAAFTLIQARREMGEPFLRLAGILGGVAAATAMCLYIFRGRRMRQHFRLGQTGSGSR